MKVYRAGVSVLINAEDNADADHQTKQRASSRREEGQRYADNGKEGDAHTYINDRLGAEHCEDSRRDVHSALVGGEPCDPYAAQTDEGEKQKHRKAAHHSELLSDGNENKVVITLGNALNLSKLASEEALSEDAAVSQRHPSHPLLEADALKVRFKVEKIEYSCLLILRQNEEKGKGRRHRNSRKGDYKIAKLKACRKQHTNKDSRKDEGRSIVTLKMYEHHGKCTVKNQGDETFKLIYGGLHLGKMGGKGDDEAYLQKLRRLKGNVSRKQKPSLIVSTLGGVAYKEGEDNGNKTCGSHQKPEFLQGLIVYIRDEDGKSKTDHHCKKLSGELTEVFGVGGGRHNRDATERSGDKGGYEHKFIGFADIVRNKGKNSFHTVTPFISLMLLILKHCLYYILHSQQFQVDNCVVKPVFQFLQDL